MIYGSVCSGIEAASVAWHPLGWRSAFLSEIEAFPRAVLAHHYPDVPLHGDFTTIKADQYAAIDVLVGGTPCQSFSVAGLRAGLDDERGNLALEFCLLARRLSPKWVVWENVPGVLSLDGGRAFASILGGLAECGYGLAYRVLDAQFVRVDGFGRAVPQRRRRVFVVGCLGDWRRAAAVLFERESLRWDTPPRREPGKGVAATIRSSSSPRGHGNSHGLRGDGQDNLVARCDTARQTRLDWETKTFVAQGVALRGRDGGATAELTGDVMTSLRTGGGGGDKPHVLLPFDETQITSPENGSNPQHGDPCHPLVKGGRAPTVAYRTTGNDGAYETGDCAPCLNTATDPNQITLLQSWRVRRLTPTECERLQGFPDRYTAITYRGKPAADGPRYKSLGNSMAVNCMRWLGQRIEMVESI